MPLGCLSRLSKSETETLTGVPLVSVIIPCYNQAHFLGEALDSVLAQSYPNFEIIVVDDGSTDNTSEVAGRYAGVQCIRQTNQRQAAARNAGLGRAMGNTWCFWMRMIGCCRRHWRGDWRVLKLIRNAFGGRALPADRDKRFGA